MLQQLGSLAVLGQAIPAEMSMLGWMVRSISSLSGILMMVSGLLLLIGACYLLRTKQRPIVIAYYLVLLPLPVLISICGFIRGSISSLLVIASVQDLQLTNADIAAGLAAALLELFIALLITAPTYFVLAYALLLRTWERPSAAESIQVLTPRSPQPQPRGVPLASA